MTQEKTVEAKAELNSIGQKMRKIRSYVLREGRLTSGQQRALDEVFPILGLEFQSKLYDFEQIFKRKAPTVLEIGFGMGKSLAQQAKKEQDKDFVGIEVHKPGVGACLLLAEEYQVNNIRLIHHDAVEIIDHSVADGSLSRVQIFFPDPWHKTRHRKRRIVQTEFCQKLHNKMQKGAVLHLATDWEDYAKHMLRVVGAMPEFENISETSDYVPRPDSRPLTKFEQRGHRLGHGVWDLMFKKV